MSWLDDLLAGRTQSPQNLLAPPTQFPASPQPNPAQSLFSLPGNASSTATPQPSLGLFGPPLQSDASGQGAGPMPSQPGQDILDQIFAVMNDRARNAGQAGLPTAANPLPLGNFPQAAPSGPQTMAALPSLAPDTSSIANHDPRQAAVAAPAGDAVSATLERIAPDTDATPPVNPPIPQHKPHSYQMMPRDQVANIVFNETRSLSGPGLDDARYAIAQAIRNGEQKFGYGRPPTASEFADNIPPAEQAAHDASYLGALEVDADRWNSIDSTNGATLFNLRGNAIKSPWQGIKGFDVLQQFGPFDNAFPTTGPNGLPGKGVYINIYRNPRASQ